MPKICNKNPAFRRVVCPGQDLNLHELPRYHLKVVRLPIPPPGRGRADYMLAWAGVESGGAAGPLRRRALIVGRSSRSAIDVVAGSGTTVPVAFVETWPARAAAI